MWKHITSTDVVELKMVLAMYKKVKHCKRRPLEEVWSTKLGLGINTSAIPIFDLLVDR